MTSRQQEHGPDADERTSDAPPGAPVVHVEVRGARPDRLQAFYGAVAGWTFDNRVEGAQVVGEVSEPGRYGFVEPADGSGPPAGVGGGAGHEPYAIFYLGVADVAAAVERAEQHGGRRVMGPVRAQGRDLVVAHVRDPEGSLIGFAGPQ